MVSSGSKHHHEVLRGVSDKALSGSNKRANSDIFIYRFPQLSIHSPSPEIQCYLSFFRIPVFIFSHFFHRISLTFVFVFHRTFKIPFHVTTAHGEDVGNFSYRLSKEYSSRCKHNTQVMLHKFSRVQSQMACTTSIYRTQLFTSRFLERQFFYVLKQERSRRRLQWPRN